VLRERLRLLAHEFGLQLKVVLRLSHIQSPDAAKSIECESGSVAIPDLRRLLIETVGGFTGGGKKSVKNCPHQSISGIMGENVADDIRPAYAGNGKILVFCAVSIF
jgi:hypothetical protein